MKRCAIYTRKSTSAGLETAFNSLDAQYEACAAYIARQAGWEILADRYDDGGFTGANIERPAFTRLLADVEAEHPEVSVDLVINTVVWPDQGIHDNPATDGPIGRTSQLRYAKSCPRNGNDIIVVVVQTSHNPSEIWTAHLDRLPIEGEKLWPTKQK